MNLTAFVSSEGIRLDRPEAGDIVTVRVKKAPQKETSSAHLLGGISLLDRTDEAFNPQHYKMTSLWLVKAVNGGQAVVESLDGYTKGRREIWPISLHEWYEAKTLYDAMQSPAQEVVATTKPV